MTLSWQWFLNASSSFAPDGSTKRKIIQVVGIIFVFQGVSIALLSSHFGPALGVLSMALGVLILLIFPPKLRPREQASEEQRRQAESDTYGIRLVDFIYKTIGGTYVTIALGIVIIAGILIYNRYLSSRPDIGDLDLLSMILGGLLVIYPYASKRFKVEMCFALMFIAFVVVILVIPQALLSFNGDSTLGNWYVHYMLAAPFAQTLNLLGIEARSAAEVVWITFKDGSTHPLGISTACAGLYSFSIFVSAFFSFVLVVERLPIKITALVLSFGLLVAYVGNVFRMVVIGVVGYYHGMEALLWAHDNVGWMVFLAWSSIFWYLVIRYADRRRNRSKTVEQSERTSSQP